jgi:hypothetical protein
MDMHEKHASTRLQYNPNKNERKVAAPSENESSMNAPDGIKLLNEDERKEYMGITGEIVWITGRTRPSIRFESRDLSSKNTSPTRNDMQRAVWMMNFLLYTKDMPLALGGSIIDPRAVADCSLCTAEESKSVIGGYVTLCEKSGVILTFVKVQKCAITQIMEGEVYAAVEAADLTIYMSNLCAETTVEILPVRQVYCDNKSGIDWLHGAVAMKGTKPYAKKLYRGRHLQAEGFINMQCIESIRNASDKLTKRTFGKDRVYKTAVIQGHGLLQALRAKIAGVWSTEVPVIVSRDKRLLDDEADVCRVSV